MKIFVTVGTDLPFDRLARVVDEWARTRQRTDVFAQIGKTDWRPAYIPYSQFLEPPEFAQRLAAADTIVSHAGMGTILSALQYERPILVMPRRASLGEQRNEHQLATAKHLAGLGKIHVALDEAELLVQLDRLGELKSRGKASAYAAPELTTALNNFIHRR